MAAKLMKKKKRISEDSTHDWDIDAYRTDYESEEHWLLRRRFMEVHKEKFGEEKLVCLAAVFTNMEFLGCKYPPETMRLVGELSQEVAKDFRAKRAHRLKRTFVAASDAAEARVKAFSGSNRQQQQQSVGNTKNKIQNIQLLSIGDASKQLFDGLPYGSFVLLLHGGQNCLRASADRCKIKYDEKRSDGKTIICLNDHPVASGTGDSKKAAKQAAFQAALKTLQNECYSYILNPHREVIKIEKKNDQVVCELTHDADAEEEKKLDGSNKGYKMMRMMGWTGGGLGSAKQGREDPISYLFKNNRVGVGGDGDLNREYLTKMLENYINSNDMRELQFESNFSKSERADLHELAARLDLKSGSSGGKDNRRLTISKKVTNEQILTEVLINKNPEFCKRYLVQVPQSKSHLFPDHCTQLQLNP